MIKNKNLSEVLRDGMSMLSHDGLKQRPKLGDCFAQNSAINHNLVQDRLDALLEGIQRRQGLAAALVQRTDPSFHFFI